MWHGSKESCDCRLSDHFSLSSYNLTNKIYWENCTSSMVLCSCKQYEAQPEAVLESFFNKTDEHRRIGDGLFVCVKRQKGLNFVKIMEKNMRVNNEYCQIG